MKSTLISQEATRIRRATTINLQQRGIPWALLEEAMLLGACRMYLSWIDGQALEPIRSQSYFEPLIAEVREKPLPLGYAEYLRKQVRQLAKDWNELRESRHRPQESGYPDILL